MTKQLSEKQKMFSTELAFIKYDNNRNLIEYAINNIIPNQFFIIPPSSTGKYHPLCTMKEGGLVLHTKRLIFFALQLADGHKLDPKDKDRFIVAGILHDIAKKAKYDKSDEFSYEDHPLEAISIIRKHEEKLIDFVTREELELIYDLIKFHMGPWTPKSVAKKLTEYTEFELLFYHSDYLSSRPTLTTPVDGVEMRVPEEVREVKKIENSSVHTS